MISLETVASWALGAVAIAAAMCVVRIVKGPTAFDRLAAFECLVLDLVGAVILVSLREHTEAFMDVVLVVALLGFVGTLSFAAYLEGTLDA
jgi:multisubunit Na+/H+ antiporter MnhF subunit